MSLTSLSVIFAVLTSNINHRGFKELDLPGWFRSAIVVLAKVMCMKLTYITRQSSDEIKMVQIRCAMKEPYSGMRTTFSNDSGCNLIDYENGDPPQYRASQNTRRNNVQEKSWELEEILRRLQILVQKEEEKEKSDDLCKKWIEAAEVIDRFLFWGFVTATSASTIIILMVMPLLKTVET